MSTYADPPPPVPVSVPKPLSSSDIDKLFKRKSGWFNRDRVRKRLYKKGFPHPIQRGQWSSLAVYAWMTLVGANHHNLPPDVKPRPRRRGGRGSSNGYATP